MRSGLAYTATHQPAHPFAVAMESTLRAPNAQASLYPWREPAERSRLALRHVRILLAGSN